MSSVLPSKHIRSRLVDDLQGIVYGGLIAAVLCVSAALPFAAVRGEPPFVKLTKFTSPASLDFARDRILPFAIPIGALVGLLIAERRRTPQ